MAIVRYLVLACVATFAAAAIAKQSIPSAYDGYRDGSVVVGGVNYPLALHGIAIDWDDMGRLSGVVPMLVVDAFEVVYV